MGPSLRWGDTIATGVAASGYIFNTNCQHTLEHTISEDRETRLENFIKGF